MKNKLSIASILIALCYLSGCSQSIPKPVPIQSEDMCGYCRMSITEKQFAAELITPDEKVFKFDDAGCLMNFIETRDSKTAALYVTDFNSRAWIPAERAYYVSTAKVQTPMGGGFLAFQNANDASDAVLKYNGRLLIFGELPTKRN